MTKKKNCTDCGACAQPEVKQNCGEKEVTNYSFYSKVLQKPFDSLDELMVAEEAYFAEQRAKEEKVSQKKADAQKVEDAFKALNAARKIYKENLTQLTKEYSEELETLKKAYELGKKDIHDNLAAAEEAYAAELKAFTTAYPEGYHLTLKDGDFETTISGSSKTNIKKPTNTGVFDLIDYFFGI